jgi:hypothetical protein
LFEEKMNRVGKKENFGTAKNSKPFSVVVRFE